MLVYKEREANKQEKKGENEEGERGAETKRQSSPVAEKVCGSVCESRPVASAFVCELCFLSLCSPQTSHSEATRLLL